MLKKKLLDFLKRLYFNTRIGWHKANLNLFSDCKKILDVGCGKGLFIKLSPHRIIGLDNNFCFLKECVNKNYTVIKGHVLDLPFVDQSFDGVYCADLIEHFSPSGARRLLIEMSRVLKVGGFLVIATPLPSKEFWNDPFHLRPYPPHALLLYFIRPTDINIGIESGYTYLPYDLKFVKLIYRYAPFYQLPLNLYFDENRIKLTNLMRPSSLLFILSNLASRMGLNNPKPEGYVVVMQKI